MRFVEALVASFGILVFGWISIPVTAHIVGASLTVQQGFQMGLIFFVLRVVWLYALRLYFSKGK